MKNLRNIISFFGFVLVLCNFPTECMTPQQLLFATSQQKNITKTSYMPLYQKTADYLAFIQDHMKNGTLQKSHAVPLIPYQTVAPTLQPHQVIKSALRREAEQLLKTFKESTPVTALLSLIEAIALKIKSLPLFSYHTKELINAQEHQKHVVRYLVINYKTPTTIFHENLTNLINKTSSKLSPSTNESLQQDSIVTPVHQASFDVVNRLVGIIKNSNHHHWLEQTPHEELNALNPFLVVIKEWNHDSCTRENQSLALTFFKLNEYQHTIDLLASAPENNPAYYAQILENEKTQHLRDAQTLSADQLLENNKHLSCAI